jgi:hypothetical protein
VTYSDDVIVPMYGRFADGKLTAVMVIDPTPGSLQKIDITVQLMELLDARQRGDVPVTTQDG